MSRLVALEWDAKEARVAIGRKRAGGVAVDQAFSVPLPQREEGSTAEPDVGAILAKALADHGMSRSEALVAVGRANIELRFLTTPPVPEDETPDVVRFQAVRSFTTFGEEWALDYVPLSPNADGGMNVLAAAIAPDLLGQIRKDCTAAGITLSRLVLRPFAAAALLKNQLHDDQCRMIVDLLRDDADLTVLIGSQVIFPRTVRLPTVNEADVLARALLAEGRRTMIAAQNQLGGRKVEEVIIFGDGQHHSQLKLLLEKELSLPVKLIDPFDQVEWADSRQKKPEFPGTFAPLLGMMLDEATDTAPVIDFLHPRKRKPPPNYRRQYLTAAAAIAAVVLLAFGYMQWRLWGLDAEISRLGVARFKAEKLAKESAKPIKDADSLDAFAAGDVTWLDELALLAQKLPPPEAAVLSDVNINLLPKGGGGTMKFVGHIDKADRSKELEEAFRDKQHTITGRSASQDVDLPTLQWSLDETVTVLPQADAAAATKAATGKTASSTGPASKASTKTTAPTKAAAEAPSQQASAKPEAPTKQGGAK